MAEDDIYGNKERYEQFKASPDSMALPLGTVKYHGKRKYFCRNKADLRHFSSLFEALESTGYEFCKKE